jgi:hypothetical protein
LTGGAGQGPHRSDLIVTYFEKNMPAAQCSTGEQKALLIGIVLSHAGLIKAERGDPAVLLLDEVAAHLDEDRRAALFGALAAMGGASLGHGNRRFPVFRSSGRCLFFPCCARKNIPEKPLIFLPFSPYFSRGFSSKTRLQYV